VLVILPALFAGDENSTEHLRRGLTHHARHRWTQRTFEVVEGAAVRKCRLPPMHEQIIGLVQPLGLTSRPLRQGTEGEPTAGGELFASGQANGRLAPSPINRLIVIMPPSHRSQFDDGQKTVAVKTPHDRS
jgi:hypothetical protein